VQPLFPFQFHNTDSRRGLNHSSFACGSITDELNELVGKRSFITGINEALSIDVHFTNQDFEGTASEQRTLGSNSTFVLDITAYSGEFQRVPFKFNKDGIKTNV